MRALVLVITAVLATAAYVSSASASTPSAYGCSQLANIPEAFNVPGYLGVEVKVTYISSSVETVTKVCNSGKYFGALGTYFGTPAVMSTKGFTRLCAFRARSAGPSVTATVYGRQIPVEGAPPGTPITWPETKARFCAAQAFPAKKWRLISGGPIPAPESPALSVAPYGCTVTLRIGDQLSDPTVIYYGASTLSAVEPYCHGHGLTYDWDRRFEGLHVWPGAGKLCAYRSNGGVTATAFDKDPNAQVMTMVCSAEYFPAPAWQPVGG